MEQLQFFTETHTTQLRSPGGEFTGFKRPCRGCERYVSELEDGYCAACNGHRDQERARFDCRVQANAQADQALRIMSMAGHWAEAWGLTDEAVAGFAAAAARQCYRLCLHYQRDLGGHPADGGDKF